MSVSLITGLPRHGKSYYGVLQVIEELRRSERFVVTNLPLDLKELQAFCDVWIDKPVEVGKRLRMLTAQESAEFWLYDPEGDIAKGTILWESKRHEWQRTLKTRPDRMVPDFQHRQRPEYAGCLAVIDEAHIFFDAYAWSELGDDMSFFVSQHGHMRWDIMLITQHPAKLAKRLKLDLEEWTVVTNLGRVKGWQGVTIPGWFRRHTYAGKPDDPNPGEPETGTFKLKAETIGKLYSTSAGVGLAGRVDTQEKKRGKHWGRWIGSVAGLCILAVVVPTVVLKVVGKGIHSGLSGYLTSATTIATNAVRSVQGAAPVLSAPAAPAPPARAAVARLPDSEPHDIAGGVRAIGYCPEAVMLDDGRALWASDWRFRKLRGGVFVEGLGFFPWGTSVSSAPRPSAPEPVRSPRRPTREAPSSVVGPFGSISPL